MQIENLEGLIPLLGGGYALLIVYKKIPLKNDKSKKLLHKHEKLIKMAGVITFILGLLQLVGVL